MVGGLIIEMIDIDRGTTVIIEIVGELIWDDMILVNWFMIKQFHLGQNSEYRSYYPGPGLSRAFFI